MTSPRPRRWRRRLVYAALTIAGLRAALALAMPWLVEWSAAAIGCRASYRSGSLSLLGLSLRFEDLVVADAAHPGGEPLLVAQEITVDASMWQLLHGEFVVVDAALTGCEVRLERGADGAFRLPAGLQPATTTAPAEPPPPAAEPTAPPTGDPPSFELPFQLVSARVHDLTVRWHDATRSPAATFVGTFDLDVSDLGHRDRKGHLELRAHSQGRLDHLRLQVDTTTNAGQLAVHYQLAVRGLQLAELPVPAEGLEPLQGAKTAGLDLAGSWRIDRATPAPGAMHVAGELQGALSLDEKERLRVRAEAGPVTGADLSGDVPFSFDLHVDDLVDSLRLADGRFRQAGGETMVSAALEARGLTLQRFAGALRANGVSIADGGLAAAAGLRGSFVAGRPWKLSMRAQDLVLQGGGERCELPLLQVDGLTADAAGLTIDAVRLRGPQLAAARHADGTIALAGLRYLPPADPQRPAAATPPAPAAPRGPFALRLQEIAWEQASLQFVDGTRPRQPVLQVADVAVRGSNLGFGADQPAGSARATLRMPGSIEALRAELQVQPRVDGATVDLQCTATGVSLRELAPWLEPLGLRPQWQDARFVAAASASVTQAGDATALTARLANVRLTDGESVLLGLRNAELTSLRQDASGLDIGPVRIDEPFVAIARDRDGALRIAGVAFADAAPAPPAEAPAGPATGPPPAPARAVRVGPISLHGAELALSDRRGELRALALGFDADVALPRDAVGKVPFGATLRIPGAVDSLAVRGDFTPAAGGGGHLGLEITGSGIRGEGLTPLLPTGLRATTNDGSLQASATVDLRPSGAGTGVDLVVSGLTLRDGGTELAALDRLELLAPELSRDLVHIHRCAAQGLRAIAARTDEGLHVPGLVMIPTSAAAAATEQPPAAAGGPLTALPMPLLRCDEFDVGCERITFLDRRGGDGAPAVFQARLRLLEPWATSRDLAASAPARLELTASAAPLCRSLSLGVLLQPFEIAPWAELDVRADGLDPTAIATLSPALGARIGGTTNDASFAAKLRASLDLRRRDPARFDFGKPFGGQLLAEGIHLQDAAGNRPLLSIGAVDLRLRAIDPGTGDVLVKSLEVDSPVLQMTQGKEGIEVAGLLLRAPAAASGPTAPPVRPQGGAGAPGPEFAVDRLRVQGMDVAFRDETTVPPTHLPAVDIDFDLLRFSTRVFTEPRPFAFRLSASGGNVDLDQRVLRSSLVHGLVGSATDALALRKDEHPNEARPLFGDLDVQGDLQVYPLPKGRCRATLTGFELPALRGIAGRGAVTINDGTCDASVVADMRAGDGIFVKSGVTFTWLSISEPANGPISTYLRLPAPLDTVLFVLRNDADEQRLPLQAHLPAEGISPSAVAEAAIEALALAIADAVARSPFRIAGAVTGLLGLGSQPSDLDGLAASLDCQPGSAEPDLQALAKLLQRTADDPEVKFVLTHDLGAADMQRASDLANPPAAVRRAAIERLRARRSLLIARRTALATEAGARFAAAQHEAPLAHAALAAVDQELGALDETLDEALARLDDDSERARIRNARKAAESLAMVRLEAVRAELASRLPGGGTDRIEVRAPRSIPAHGVDGGGRVVATPRRRAPEPTQRR